MPGKNLAYYEKVFEIKLLFKCKAVSFFDSFLYLFDVSTV